MTYLDKKYALVIDIVMALQVASALREMRRLEEEQRRRERIEEEKRQRQAEAEQQAQIEEVER